MLSVLILYKFHDPSIQEVIEQVVLPVTLPTCRVMTIEQASDDPSDDLYWLKVYHVLRFSVDIVITVRKDGEARSESIAFEQDYISRNNVNGHPFSRHMFGVGTRIRTH